MSHQPYETYLFSGETITSEQKQRLDLHLKECDYCRNLDSAMTDLEEIFSCSPTPDPTPGFSQRWQVRLDHIRHTRQNRNLWLMTMGLFSFASLIILLLLFYHFQHLNLTYELSQLIARTSRLIAEIRSSLNLFRTLINTLPVIVPIMLVFSFGTMFALSFLTVSWFRTIIKLYSPIQERGH